LQKDLQLESPHVVLTQMALAIIEDDLPKLKALAKEERHPNLPCFTAQLNAGKSFFELEAMPKQQRITALMLACYLGKFEAIEVLLAIPKICVNQRTLQTGETALFYFLKSPVLKAEEGVKIFRELLRHKTVTALDDMAKDGESLLQLCIDQKEDEFVATFLITASSKNPALPQQLIENLYLYDYDQEEDPITGCLINNKITHFELLLVMTNTEKIAEMFLDGTIPLGYGLNHTDSKNWPAIIKALFEKFNGQKKASIDEWLAEIIYQGLVFKKTNSSETAYQAFAKTVKDTFEEKSTLPITAKVVEKLKEKFLACQNDIKESVIPEGQAFSPARPLAFSSNRVIASQAISVAFSSGLSFFAEAATRPTAPSQRLARRLGN